MTNAQLDLFAKPFHSITVFRFPHPTYGGKALVVRFDNLDAMRADIERQLDSDVRLRNRIGSIPVAYIFACAREFPDGKERVITLDTYYPVET